MAGTKFYGSTSTFLLSVVAFISLSGYAKANDTRQCYWCGPLAEQVHRSRRAPPCDAPKAHVTSCDPGYLHCAVVATAPPYTESRYCVKLYQDECYLDFCNSTKTWKMTCPCKGDLCNGQNSDREDKAFAELLEKTQKPIKKRTKKSINDTLLEPTHSQADNTSTVDANLSVIEIRHNESYTSEFYEKEFITHIKVENIVDESESMTQLEREEFVTTSNLVVSHVNDDESNFKNTLVHNNDDTTMNDMGQTDSIINVETTAPMLESTIKIDDVNKNEKPISGNLVKPSEKLPTAEALQEDADVANDSPQVGTTSIDDLVTTDSTERTTDNSTIRKNSAMPLSTFNLNYFALCYITYKAFF